MPIPCPSLQTDPSKYKVQRVIVRYDKSSNHIIMSGIATKVFDGKINI